MLTTYVNIKKKERKDKRINRTVLFNSFTTSMYKKATNKLHFKVGIMMEKLYNFVIIIKKSGQPVEYFFIEPVTGNKHIINNGLTFARNLAKKLSPLFYYIPYSML